MAEEEKEKPKQGLFDRIRGMRGLFYRKTAGLIENLESSGQPQITLPGFAIGETKHIVDFPEIKDPSKVNLTYPLIEPFAYANIKWNPGTKELEYLVIEPPLDEGEIKIFRRISDAVIELVEVGFTSIKNTGEAIPYLRDQVTKVINNLGLSLADTQYTKLMYYIYKNFIGFNEIEPFLQDPNIEDISCDGIDTPIFVIHRKFGSVKTNVSFKSIEDLREFVVKLAERAGRYVSYAEPILDGTLPDGSRVAATMAGDVATRGPTFTIRKFSEKPISPIEQIELGTADANLLSYFWYLIERGASMLVVGGVATGKTSLLNTISMFIPPEAKIVSIEDSVLPETEILIERDGEITKTQIGKLVDSVLEKNIRKIDGADVGYAQDIKLFSIDKSGKVKLAKPSALIRHRVKKKVLDLTTTSGRKISVTKDHSLFSLDKDCNISPIAGGDIKVGSFICTPRRLPINCSDFRTNLLNYPEIFSDCFVEGPGISKIVEKKIAMLGKKHSKGWVNYLKRNGVISVGLVEGEYVDAGSSVIYSRASSNRIPATIDVDVPMATLIGIWLADGSYDKNSAIFSVDDSESKRVVRETAWGLGLKSGKHSDGVSEMINSTVFKRYFKNVLDLEGDAYTKKIPDWIFDLPSDKAAAVLRGYFSGDGCVKKNEVAIASASLQLLHDVQTFLLRFGINMRISTKQRKDETYEARISGGFLKIFRDEIGFLQAYKNEKLNRVCGGEGREFNDLIPIQRETFKEIKKSLRSLVGRRMTYKQWKVWGSNYIYGDRKIRRNNLSKLVVLLEESKGDERLITKIKELAENDVFWDRIKEVREREYEGFVYDFSVPENENFICNNIVAHNTREIRIPHEHWIAGLARTGFGIPTSTGQKYGEVTLFDLLKESFRQNPDYVIVGEVRGAETYVMFQGMSSGHPSLSTFHAGSVESVIKRLTSPPIELAPSLIESLDVIIIMIHARDKGKSARRIKEVVEIVSVDSKTQEVKTNVVFRWDPVTDSYVGVNDSQKLEKFAVARGGSLQDALKDVEDRKKILQWLGRTGKKDYIEVSKFVNMYVKEKKKLFELIGQSPALLESRTATESRIAKSFGAAWGEASPVTAAAEETALGEGSPERARRRRTSILDLLGMKMVREK